MDLLTGTSTEATITGSSSLTSDEILRMINEAEDSQVEDGIFKEASGIKDVLHDRLVQVETMLRDSSSLFDEEVLDDLNDLKISLVEAIEGVDSVSFYFVGQTNEEYHTTIDNLANASAAQLNRQIGLDDFGDVIINSGELVLLRGGWTDRYGTYYEVGIVPGKPSALNISIASVNLRTLNNQLNSEQRARIIAQNQ
jgi:hypothetical protein